MTRVSVLIPCRNEERYIAECVTSVLQSDFPTDGLEILVIDGRSEDGTRDVVRELIREHPGRIGLLDNPKRGIAAALNLGIREAKGNILLRVDAHSTLATDYISRSVAALTGLGVGSVGGRVIVRPGREGIVASAIAEATGHPFATGRHFRWMQTVTDTIEVDHVSFGCWDREMLQRSGLRFDEDLARGEDVDFNAQIRAQGARILFLPDLLSYYRARPGLRSFARYHFSVGRWIGRRLRGGRVSTWREIVPLAFVLSLASSATVSLVNTRALWITALVALAYAVATILASAGAAVRSRRSVFLLLLPVVFATAHVSHGAGALWGLGRGE